MLVNEAKWFNTVIREIGPDQLVPLLNVGSQTLEFRILDQPWIQEYIFNSFRREHDQVTHLDLQAAPGVDLVGDLSDERFLTHLQSLKFRSALCSNLLEHVENREAIAAALVSVVAPGGFILVSCPYQFPFHPDPIDTMFRPNVPELTSLFAGTKLIKGDLMKGGTFGGYLYARYIRNPSRVLKDLKRSGANSNPRPQGNDSVREMVMRYLPWLFRQFQATCVVLQKE